jgi:O-antigen/teichoic acid export membrane protein
MMNIAFSTISAPYWSAFTYAWVQKDFDWIKKAQRKLIYIWLFVVATSFVVLFFSDYLYSIWVGDKVLVPVSLSIAVFVYMVIFTFGMIYNVFINSTGKIYLQTISLSILTVLYIPLVLFFINKLQWGVNSIPVALSIVSIYTVIISPVQSKRILKGSANGIWNK